MLITTIIRLIIAAIILILFFFFIERKVLNHSEKFYEFWAPIYEMFYTTPFTWISIASFGIAIGVAYAYDKGKNMIAYGVVGFIIFAILMVIFAVLIRLLKIYIDFLIFGEDPYAQNDKKDKQKPVKKNQNQKKLTPKQGEAYVVHSKDNKVFVVKYGESQTIREKHKIIKIDLNPKVIGPPKNQPQHILTNDNFHAYVFYEVDYNVTNPYVYYKATKTFDKKIEDLISEKIELALLEKVKLMTKDEIMNTRGLKSKWIEIKASSIKDIQKFGIQISTLRYYFVNTSDHTISAEIKNIYNKQYRKVNCSYDISIIPIDQEKYMQDSQPFKTYNDVKREVEKLIINAIKINQKTISTQEILNLNSSIKNIGVEIANINYKII